MWSRLRPHAVALGAIAVAGISALALGQPAPRRTPTAGFSGGSALPEPDDEPASEEAAVGDPALGSAAGAATASAVEAAAIPPWSASPRRFAVAKFENQSGARAYDWLVAGAPFEISEKTEAVYHLEPTGGDLHVTDDYVDPEPGPVVAFAAKRGGVKWVITGWADRPNWKLRVGLTLWSVTGPTAIVIAETQRTGDPSTYHQLLGEATAEAWAKAGLPPTPAGLTELVRPLAKDPYSVTLMGRGLGHLTGALAPQSTKLAEPDLEKAVFIDPNNFEAQRLVGELYLVELATDPKADPKLASKAAGKFNYAHDLAPGDIASIRGAARAATRSEKHDLAKDLWLQLVRKKPWDLDARYHLGAELWALGDGDGAERQLDQVTAHAPDHLAARHVLVLVHAARGDTSKLVAELEAIEVRAPDDLAVKGDLATAYGAIGDWKQADAELQALVVAKPTDLPLQVRLGDARIHLNDVDGALAWYARAGRLDPTSTQPGFAAAQALWDAQRLPEAQRAYLNLQKFKELLPVTEYALGMISIAQGKADEAAWYLRRAVRGGPRVLQSWQALAAAELMRKDPVAALVACDHALVAWPRDGRLLYFAGLAHAMAGEGTVARDYLNRAVAAAPMFVPARTALLALGTGQPIPPVFKPELERPWGDAAAIDQALSHYTVIAAAMATVRVGYQSSVLGALGALGKGPMAPVKLPALKRCPVGILAPRWAAAQTQLVEYQKLGEQLESEYRFIVRHDDAGVTAGLLPGSRAKAIAARAGFKVTLADAGELRAEWTKSLVPELRAAGCDDRLLADGIKDPERYRVAEENRPLVTPEQQAQRPRPRATFYVDNTSCKDAVEVWIDGTHLGQILPGRRSALVADGGERTLCLITPSSPQCGERGTVRQVYLHDGWSTTLYCPAPRP